MRWFPIPGATSGRFPRNTNERQSSVGDISMRVCTCVLFCDGHAHQPRRFNYANSPKSCALCWSVRFANRACNTVQSKVFSRSLLVSSRCAPADRGMYVVSYPQLPGLLAAACMCASCLKRTKNLWWCASLFFAHEDLRQSRPLATPGTGQGK